MEAELGNADEQDIPDDVLQELADVTNVQDLLSLWAESDLDEQGVGAELVGSLSDLADVVDSEPDDYFPNEDPEDASWINEDNQDDGSDEDDGVVVSNKHNLRRNPIPLWGQDDQPSVPKLPHVYSADDLWGRNGSLRDRRGEYDPGDSEAKLAALRLHQNARLNFSRIKNGQKLSELYSLVGPTDEDLDELEDEMWWTNLGSCRGLNSNDQFFPARGESTKEAKAVCVNCPVRHECLDFAMTNGEKFGIWGGLSERERRRIRRQRATARRVATIEAGLEQILDDTDKLDEDDGEVAVDIS